MKTRFRTEKEFGLLVGTAFVLLGGWWLYRGKMANFPVVLLILGTTLVLLGLVFPKALVYPNKAWLKLAEALAFVMTRIILGIVFFLIVTPIGVIKRLSGWDPLHRRSHPKATYWHPYPVRQHDKRHYEKMY